MIEMQLANMLVEIATGKSHKSKGEALQAKLILDLDANARWDGLEMATIVHLTKT